MATRNQILKCGKTGLTLEALTDGSCCELSCCGEPVELLAEKTADTGKEKHVPVIQKGKSGVKIVVGSVEHPMTEEHYIQWIEVINGDYVNRKNLKPGVKPEAEFYVPEQPGLVVRSYCNIHGLWRA